MPSLPSALYTVQEFEIAVDKARARIERIEEQLANDEVVVARRNELDKLNKSYNQTQATIKDLELEISSLTSKIEEVDELLYSGKLKNPKELKDRQEELESLRRRHKTLEARLLAALTEAETVNKQHEAAEESLSEAVDKQKQDNVDLIAEKETLQEQILDNLRKRKTMVKTIPDNVYKNYRILRKRKNGQAVAPLKGNACGLCGVSQTTSAVQDIQEGNKIMYCENCGRMLASV
jgi:predicted  nucleic acid-binding Zn-ribbon protein